LNSNHPQEVPDLLEGVNIGLDFQSDAYPPTFRPSF